MPLKLEAYKPVKDYIEYGDIKLFVTSDISEEIMFRFQGFASLTTDSFDQKKFDEAFEIIKDYLKLASKPEDVDAVFSKIKLSEKMKILMFICEFIKQNFQTTKKKRQN